MTDLTLDMYQTVSGEFACFPEPERFHYAYLGLANEVGELGGKLKHLWRDKGKTTLAQLTDEERKALKAELGDCLWYVAAFAGWLNEDLGDVAQANLDKLRSRADRGVILGEGDNR
jgi:NTP pyrophosphatase (non-canonical NTP hydrolase)